MNESGTEESQGFSEPETATEICSSTPSKENFQHMVGRSNAALTMNGNLSTSTQAGPVVTVNHPIRLVFYALPQTAKCLDLVSFPGLKS